MGFNIISELDSTMYSGQIISYKVSPLLGITMNWVTEITHVEYKKFFVDEQRVGPYSIWHHKHFFKEIDEGVEMTDTVHYRLPFPILANRFHSLIVKPKLKQIFEYRTEVLVNRFGNFPVS